MADRDWVGMNNDAPAADLAIVAQCEVTTVSACQVFKVFVRLLLTRMQSPFIADKWESSDMINEIVAQDIKKNRSLHACVHGLHVSSSISSVPRASYTHWDKRPIQGVFTETMKQKPQQQCVKWSFIPESITGASQGQEQQRLSLNIGR